MQANSNIAAVFGIQPIRPLILANSYIFVAYGAFV